jgi:5-methylcytosine-specific restriction endonuclease McrBC regulatory subunit McrC
VEIMPHFIFIQGLLGAGKTLTASIMAHYYKNVIENRFGSSIELFSNYELKDSIPMDHYTDWYKVADAQGSICVWDESQRMFDSRTSLKFEQVISTELLMYVRKLGSVQIFVSPSIYNVDSRIRQLTEVLINVRTVGNKGITLDYFDYQAQQFGNQGKFLHSRYIPQGKLKKIYALNLYDTFTLIKGFPLPSTEQLAKKFFIELERRHDIARGKIKEEVPQLA